MNYYNGIILRGYVRGGPNAVLSGGRYDKLMARFGRNAGAMGFAINLSEVASYYSAKPEYDADILLIYNKDHTPGEVFAKAQSLRKNGNRVIALQNIPEGKIQADYSLVTKGRFYVEYSITHRQVRGKGIQSNKESGLRLRDVFGDSRKLIFTNQSRNVSRIL